MDDLQPLLELAVDVAHRAGALLLDGLDSVRTTVETKSTRTDMVTEMDRASERLVVTALREARPDDALLGEEGTSSGGTSGVRWVVDPLDGTTNYLYGFPAWAVSVAAEVEGASAVGVVHDPVHGETFTAVRGQGAWCNGERLAVAGAPDLATALVGTGFSYDAVRRGEQAALLARVLPVVRDIRRAGAAALDLCWVGLGRLDAFFERGLAPWDSAAGSLVAAEAGALVEQLPDGTWVAAAPQLFEPLRALLAAADGLRGPGTGE
ncbi:MAG TPA: inositol monophosphatase family protein [Acidimicrobiales bacterium]|nr:inositol monophosphatase family protein [Acidimicrobiales bacterium]